MLFLKELSLYLSLLLQFQLFLQIASALSTIDEVPVQNPKDIRRQHPTQSQSGKHD